MRGFIAGSFILIALQVFVSGKGPDQAAGLLGWTATALQKAISPDVALIPQRKSAGTSSATTSTAQRSTVPGSATGLAAITA